MANSLLTPNRYRLRNGAVIAVRHVTLSDRQNILKGFERLSERTRYQRFLGPMHRLTAWQLDHLANVDRTERVAIAAIDISAAGRPGIGLARYYRSPVDPTTAEAAITVIDDYQRLGIGKILYSQLCDIAGRNGIATFVAEMLKDSPALRLFRGTATTISNSGGATATVRVDLRSRCSSNGASTASPRPAATQ